MKKKIIIFLISIVSIALTLFFFYCNNLSFVNTKTKDFYLQLKASLKGKGYNPSLLVVSAKRVKLHNDFQVKFSGAAKESKHLVGDAIDFLVFDVNKDGDSNEEDVDIVFQILDKEIIKDKGGVGTYKNENAFINKQMIHIDCRGNFARWER